MRKIYLVLLAVLTLLVVSCDRFEDVQLQERQSEWAVPLFTAETSFEDLFQNSPTATSVFVNERGEVTLRFSAKPALRYASEVIDPIDIPLPIPITENPQRISIPLDGDIIIERAILSGEKLNVGAEHGLTEDVVLTVTIPEFSLAGETMVLVDTIEYDGAGNSQGGIFGLDLGGWEMSIPDGTIEVSYTAKTLSGVDVALNSIALQVDKRLDFQYLEGIINNYVFEYGRDTISISLYEDFLSGSLQIEDPRIVARFGNSFGTPVRGITTDFGIVNVDGDFLAIESEGIEDGIDFPYPSFEEDFTDVKDTTIIIDKTNSNLVEIFNSRAVRVEYSLDLNVNAESIPDFRGWIADSSLLSIEVDVEVPVVGSAENFSAESYLEFDFDLDEDVVGAIVRMVNENTIPLGIDGQIYMIKGGERIDSLFGGVTPLVSPSMVDANGFSSEPSTLELSIPLEGQRLANFRESDSLLVRSFFSSANPPQSIVVRPSDRMRTSASVLLTTLHN